MAEPDPRAVGIDLVRIEAQRVRNRAGLGGESFIGFDHVDVVNGQPRPFERDRDALIGPRPITFGSTPAWPQPRIFATGFRFFSATALPVASTTAAAASLMPARWRP